MSATLDTAPAARALSKSPVWIALSTDATISAAASVQITITSTGPTAAETLRLEWLGNDLTFTVTDPLTAAALDWPLHDGVETLAAYADRVADRLRAHETLHEYFSVDHDGAGVITLTQRTLEVVDITATDGMTNVAVVVTDVTAVTAVDNLRALVQVWSDTGDPATDALLATLHSPYELPAGETEIDISAAFSSLRPHLPADTTIQIGLSLSLPNGEATAAFLNYFLRYADKYGAPAVAEVLQQSDTYIAILGSLAGDSRHPQGAANGEPYLRHNLRRRANAYDFFLEASSSILRRPMALTQPDWVYVHFYEDAVGIPAVTGPTVEVYVECTLYWSDGTSSVYQPYDTDGTELDIDTTNWIISGYRQLKIHNETPSGGTDADAYVVAYDWILKRTSDDLALTSASYRLQIAPGWDYFLLFSNGLGGCETACFRGKGKESYKTTAEKYRAPRPSDWDVSQHENQVYALEGAREWELNSGWTVDADWIEHLRQLCLSDAVWLIDVDNERFLAVTVETRDIEVKRDDETIYNLPITVRAAWVDVDANV